MTGEPVVKGNTITINSEFVFYGDTEGNESNIKKEVRRTQKAWNQAKAKVVIDGKVYKIKYKISAQIVDGATRDEAAHNATPEEGGRSYIDVCEGCNTGIEHGGGRGQLNVDDILNEERTFIHEYGHENGFIDDNQFDNSSYGHHDEIGLPGPDDTRVPSIMSPRGLAIDAPKKYGLSSFGTSYTKDGMIDATKRANPTQREVNMTINNGQELLLEKIRPKLKN